MKINLYHPSDEMYGADKVALCIVDALRDENLVEVSLPNDLNYPDRQFSRALHERGVNAELKPLPVLRRAYFNLRGVLTLTSRMVATWRNEAGTKGATAYINTSALAPLLPILKVRGARTIFHIHENLSGLDKTIVNTLALFANEIIVVSHGISSGLWGINRRKARVVYNGFSIQGGNSHPKGDRLSLLIASRWNTWKGHESFLGALAQVPNFCDVVIAGSPPVSGEAVDVIGLSQRLGLDERITFTGEVSNISELIQTNHIVVVPSTKPDPLPTIAIEALAFGRPVLGANHGGIGEIVSDGETGWLFPPDNLKDWLNSNWSTLTVEQSAQKASACRERFDRLFSQERFASEIQGIVVDK